MAKKTNISTPTQGADPCEFQEQANSQLSTTPRVRITLNGGVVIELPCTVVKSDENSIIIEIPTNKYNIPQNLVIPADSGSPYQMVYV